MRLPIVSGILLAYSLAAPGAVKLCDSALVEANESYSKGDCDTSLPLYKSLSESGNCADLIRDESTFRMAYCHLFLENFTDAEALFTSFLKKYPGHGEARQKLAETYYALGKLEEAKAEPAKI